MQLVMYKTVWKCLKPTLILYKASKVLVIVYQLISTHKQTVLNI